MKNKTEQNKILQLKSEIERLQLVCSIFSDSTDKWYKKYKTLEKENIMRESTIEKSVCKYAKERGWLTYKFVSPGNKAVPDRMFMRNSMIFFIEFKAPGKKPTKLQEKVIADITSEGFAVYVIDNIKHGKFVINLYGNA